MEVPEIYAYIYRNLLNSAGSRTIIDSSTLFFSIKKVVRKAPAETIRVIIREMEGWQMIKKLEKPNFKIIKDDKILKFNKPSSRVRNKILQELKDANYKLIKNKKLDKKINGLKSHVFPIDV